MIKKLRKILIIAQLVISLALGSPGYVLAAAEAPTAGEAPTVQSSPSPEVASPTPQAAAEAPSAPEASPAPNSDPTPTPSPTISANSETNQNNNEVDDDPQWKQDLEQQIEDDLAKKYYGGNVGDTSIESGDANASGIVLTNVNNAAVDTSGSSCGACSGGSASATNSGNGSGSTNDAAVTNGDNSSVYINNDATVNNNLNFDADSGNNDSSKNVGDTEIITGDANVVATVITDANTTALGIYEFNVNGNQNGDIILGQQLENCINCGGSSSATNSGNGAESTNNASVDTTNTSTEVIENDGDILNQIDIDANSGNNEASKNVGDSSIQTGDANVVANVINTLNTVVDGVLNTVNIFGDMVGNIVQAPVSSEPSDCSSCACGTTATAANVGNGSGSLNDSSVSTQNTSDTTITNNATVNNNLNIDATTGDNETNFNTGGENLVETGDATVNANVVNVANVNVAAGDCSPVYMVFINDVTGGWKGNILGAAAGTYFYTSSGEFYFVDGNGQLVAVNTGNGADSTNNADVNSSNSETTTINNNGTITNNININANTGGNDASKNTGGDSTIKTGDANVAINVVNFINSNFSGRKIVMTLVNVFGSWIGNFVPAGYTGDVPNPNAQAVGGASSQSSGSNNGSSSVNSNGGGQNTVSIDGQVLGASAKLFGGFMGGTNNSNGTSEPETPTMTQSITKYNNYSGLEGRGLPVPLRILVLMAALGTGMFLFKKKTSLVSVKSK